MKRLPVEFALLSAILMISPGCRWAESNSKRTPNFASFGGKKDILEVVPELARTADAASGGALGCGMGGIIIKTSSGSKHYSTGLDPGHVFGSNVEIVDVHKLLESRADSNATGAPGPMSGDVGSLCYVSLSVLALAKDKSSVPVLLPLLRDKLDGVRRFSVTALKAIAEEHPGMKDRIDKELSNHSLQGTP